MPLLHHLSQIAQLTLRQWTDLVIATGELALAPTKLARGLAIQVKEDRLPDDSDQDGSRVAALTPRQARLVDRVAWTLPRAADLVPWHSDCLRQAKAGQHWLQRREIASEILLGTRLDAIGKPEMHAWLLVAGTVVTGGDIATYVPFCGNAPGVKIKAVPRT